jgi:glycosyltransferase involved in cell wall biosynthesis
VLIGIDMLGLQSSPGADRESGRYGRQLVSNLLASDSSHQYILYTHEGFPTHRVPTSRNAQRVSLAPIPGGSTRLRPTIQRVIDQNPDGLDWLLLLDPFEPNYVGVPPESPLNELKIASLLLDLAPSVVDDRRLAPLRRHDAILAVSEATANACRRRLGSASWRVSRIGLASDRSIEGDHHSEPLTRISGEELGRLGIDGPFLLAYLVGGVERGNLSGIIEAYSRLPFEHRRRHQLVIAGVIADPWSVVAYLHQQGCAEGLVLVGEVDEATLRMLYRRCSVFVSPSVEEGCGLTLVEAMMCGSVVLAGHSGAQPEIVGKAGLLADPAEPLEIAEQLAAVLSDADLEHDLRGRAFAQGARFGWDLVVPDVFAALQGEPAPDSSRRIRIDLAHVARPRIAVFPVVAKDGSQRLDLAEQVPPAWSDAYNVDLYLDPDHSALVDGISSGFGGFDVRQFDRNDGILGYHAVVYRLSTLKDLDARFDRLRTRPGLVLLDDDSCVEPLGLEPDDESSRLILGQIRDLFLTSSRLGVQTREHCEQIKACLPEFASQVFELPAEDMIDPSQTAMVLLDAIERCATDLPRGPGRRPRRSARNHRPMGSTPHSIRSSSHDDEVASRSR